MSHRLKSFAIAILTLVLWTAIYSGESQTPNPQRLIHISGTVTNDQLTLSWPVSPGFWELVAQDPAYTGEWRVIAKELYHTNENVVSVTIAQSTNQTIYRLKRTIPFPKGFVPAPPPMPATQTNLARPAKFPARP